MHGVLARIRAGEPWSDVATSLFDGEGSYGNGAAMRIAPLGAWFADDLDAVVAEARVSAAVTHAHPEAAAGAIAVAVATACAVQLRGESPPDLASGFIELVLPRVPPSIVRDGLERAARELDGVSSLDAARVLGNGSRVTAQDTVPFVVWSAARHLCDWEEAMWNTVAALGDRDTTCAMVGGIVASYLGEGGVPADWIERREPLPDFSA